MPYPTPGELSGPELELASFTSPALAGGFFTTSATWEASHQGNADQNKSEVSCIHYNGYLKDKK